MTRLTAKLVSSVLGDAIEKSDRFHIELALIKHVLKITSYQQYSKELKPYAITAKRKELRNAALANFDIIVGLKGAILECLRTRAKKEKRPEIFKKWGVPNHSSLLEGLKEQGLYKTATLKAKNCGMIFSGPNEVRNKCGNFISEIEHSMIGFAHKKLRFIATSNNTTLSTLVGDLTEKAVSTYYGETPFKSEAHLNNTVRRAFRNRGLNLIKYYTSKKRQRLSNDGNGKFSNTCIGLDLHTDNGDSENPYLYKAMGEASINMSDPSQSIAIDRNISWETLKAKLGKHRVKGTILELLTFKHDEQFLKFVKNKYPRRIRSSHDMEDVYERIGRKEFLESVQQYTGANKKQFYDFVTFVSNSI